LRVMENITSRHTVISLAVACSSSIPDIALTTHGHTKPSIPNVLSRASELI
jgi:hypothetical protein